MKRYFSVGIFSIILLMMSCQPKIEGNNKEEQGFTYEIQLAKHDFSENIEKGSIDNDKFVSEFDAFPWEEEVEAANRIEKTAPTISVNNHGTNETFWVSAGGTKDNLEYYIGHVYSKGNSEKNEPRWVVIYDAANESVIKDCFELFFEGRTADLKDKYSKLPKYGEMEEFQG